MHEYNKLNEEGTMNRIIKKSLIWSAFIMIGLSSNVAIADDQIEFKLAPPNINAKAFILVDYNTNKVLAEKDADKRWAPASLTKLMTVYVLGQAIEQDRVKYNDIVYISQNAWGGNKVFNGSSKMFLNMGDKVSIEQLLQGIIIDSGNDACVAVAEHVAGSEASYISLMNQYAQKMGLKNTNFQTVHGLDHENQYTSARDQATVASHIIRDLPNEYKFYSQQEFTYNKIKQQNRNGLLRDKDINADGLKTGHTNEAGYNLVSSATNDKMRLVAVVLGANSSKERELESKRLLQWGFNNFESIVPMSAGTKVSDVSVYYGVKNKVPVGVLKDVYLSIPKGSASKIKAGFELAKKGLEAPLKKGDVIGRVVYQLDGKNIAYTDLSVLEDLPEGGFFSKAIDWLTLSIKNLF